MSNKLTYIQGYSENVTLQVQELIKKNKLGPYLLARYPQCHDLTTDKSLYRYVQQLKKQYIRQSVPITKIIFDDKIHAVKNALGTHTFVSRQQGAKLKAKNEIRIAKVFKRVPVEFLRMIVVHELAHVKEKDHNKAFYKLCQYMEPDYFQLELDLRLYLTLLDMKDDIYSIQ